MNKTEEKCTLFHAVLCEIRKNKKQKISKEDVYLPTIRVYRDRYKSGTMSINIYNLTPAEISLLAEFCDQYTGRFQFYNLPTDRPPVQKIKLPPKLKRRIQILEVESKLDKND